MSLDVSLFSRGNIVEFKYTNHRAQAHLYEVIVLRVEWDYPHDSSDTPHWYLKALNTRRDGESRLEGELTFPERSFILEHIRDLRLVH